MEPPETVEVESPVCVCDGDAGPLGHPRVFLNMGEGHEVDCPYCGRRYRLKDGVAPAAAGGGH